MARSSDNSQPIVRVSDPILQQQQILSSIQEKMSSIERSFTFHNNVVIAIFLIGFVVLIFTVAGLIFQSWQFGFAAQRESAQITLQESLIKNTVEQQKELINSQKEFKDQLNNIDERISSQ